MPTDGYTSRIVHITAGAFGNVSCSFTFSQAIGQNSLGDYNAENQALLAAAYAFANKINELYPSLTPRVTRFYSGETTEEIDPA